MYAAIFLNTLKQPSEDSHHISLFKLQHMKIGNFKGLICRLKSYLIDFDALPGSLPLHLMMSWSCANRY